MTIQCSQKQGGKRLGRSVYLLTFPNGKCYVGASCHPAFWRSEKGQTKIKARSNSSWKANIIAANQRPKSETTIARMAQSAKNVWQSEAHRVKVNAAREKKQAELRATNPIWVQSRKEKASLAMKAKWENLEYLAKMKARKPPVLSAESRAKAVAGRLKAMTPETRASASEKMRQSWAKRKELALGQSTGKK